MIYYIIIAMLICLTYLEWSGKDNNILGDKNMEKYCYVFMATLLTLIAALRYQSDPDWQAYTEYFKNCMLPGWTMFEPGYIFVCKFFKVTFNSYYVMQFVTAVFYSYVIYEYIYKKSDKPIYTLLIFVPMCFFSVMMNIQRQALAIAIVILGMKFVEKRQLLFWIIMIILAQQFHSTAIFAFPLYFTTEYSISKKNALILFTIAVLIELLGRNLILATVQYAGRIQYLPDGLLERINVYLSSKIYGQQSQYGLGIATMIAYLSKLFIIMLYNPSKDKYMGNFILALLCTAAGRNFDVISRLHYYYTICGCGIIAYNLIDSVKLPAWLIISKKSNSNCCCMILTVYILFIYVTWFYGFHCVLNEVGKYAKDYYIPYKISMFRGK